MFKEFSKCNCGAYQYHKVNTALPNCVFLSQGLGFCFNLASAWHCKKAEKSSLHLENFCRLLLARISSTEKDMHVMQSKHILSPVVWGSITCIHLREHLHTQFPTLSSTQHMYTWLSTFQKSRVNLLEALRHCIASQQLCSSPKAFEQMHLIGTLWPCLGLTDSSNWFRVIEYAHQCRVWSVNTIIHLEHKASILKKCPEKHRRSKPRVMLKTTWTPSSLLLLGPPPFAFCTGFAGCSPCPQQSFCSRTNSVQQSHSP